MTCINAIYPSSSVHHDKEKIMGIFKLSKMTLIAQPGDGTCWCASAIMLHKWSRKTGAHTMVDPLSDAGLKRRWEENMDWKASDNAWLATTLNVATHTSIPLDSAGLQSFLEEHGPIWSAGLKTWSGGAYGHVVVICGVADTGVFIYDPQPEGYGSSRWLTWSQIKHFIDKTDASVPFFTVN